MDITLSGDKVYVAEGTYLPAAGTSFTMRENVKLYGGFPDNGTPDFGDRNWADNVTVLSGNGSHVVYNYNNALTNDAILDGFTITGGTATDDAIPDVRHAFGGGILNFYVSPTYVNLTITGNSAATGGGMYNEQASPKLINSIIRQNDAVTGGAMANANAAAPTLLNTGVAGNTATTASGMHNDASSPEIMNSIITDEIVSTNNASPNYSYSLITGSGGSGSWNAAYGIDNGNNIDADPLYTDAANGDFSISDMSPAVNAGSLALFNSAVSRGLDYKTRVRDGAIDIGPYEAQTGIEIRYVKEYAEGTGDGSSWADASENLQEMINEIDAGGQIWVAGGEYSNGVEPYSMKEGVAIYGGFPPTGNPVMADRNPEDYTSTLYADERIINNDDNGLTAAAILDGFSIRGAWTNGNGAGIYNNNVSPTYRNLFISNCSAENGGAIYNDSSSPTFTNVVIVDNSAITGSAVYNTASSPVFTNVTITGNRAGGGGPGGPSGDFIVIYNELSSSPVFRNSIIWEDDAFYQNEDDSNLTFSNCNISNSGGSLNWNSATGTDGGSNIDANPYFTSRYHILPGSPSIDTGDNAYYATAGTEIDYAGNMRLFGSNIDMGAFEEQGGVDAPIRYVRQGGTGDGLSWDTAAGSIQQMLDLSRAGREVWVAGGEYEMENEQSLEMIEGVSIYGGFPPTGNPAMADRNWNEHNTVLIGNDGPVISNEGNGLTSAARLDGFVLTGGSSYSGAGIYNEYASPVYANLLIVDNSSQYGGALYNYSSSPTFINVSMMNNYAGEYGAAMYNDYASPIFINVTIADNTGSGFMYNYESQPVFRNSIIWEDAGEIYNEVDNSHAEFSYCILKGSGGSGNWYSAVDIDGGNNLDADPGFLSEDDYSISSDSNAVDAGNNSYFDNAATSKDLAGNDRIYGGIIDLGAYENQPECVLDWDGIPLSQTVCAGATISDLAATGDNIKWYGGAAGGSPLASTKKLVTGTYYVTQTVCDESERVGVDVVINCTFVLPSLCETTLEKINTYIVAKTVPGATAYRFRITDGTYTEVFETDQKRFRFTDIAIGYYNRAYTVDVAAFVNGSWSVYGPSCAISTGGALTTRITDKFCATEVSLNTLIKAYTLPYATAYRFRIERDGVVEIIEADVMTRGFKLNMLQSYTHDAVYDIDVATMVDGVFTEYGPACTVYVPAASTRLKDNICNTNVGANTDLTAYNVMLATQYRFRVDNGTTVATIDRPVNSMKLNLLPGFSYGTSYTIDVAVMIDGTFTAYGPACTVHVPAVSTGLEAAYCEAQISPTTSIFAYSVPLATLYRFRVTDGVTTSTIDRTSRSMKLTMLADYEYGTSYTIDVAVMVNGVLSDYGLACVVTTPSSTARFAQDEAQDTEDKNVMATMEVFAHPNPYSDVFMIALETESAEQVHIQVYEISGKQVDDISVTPGELESLRLGERYAAGLYNVILTQGTYRKTLKVVKQ